MMKKTVYYITMISVIIVMTLGLTGCATKKLAIKETLTEFEKACRDLDVDGMLNCIDPDIADPIRLGLAMFGSITEVEYDDVVAGLFEGIESNGFDSEEFLRTVSVSKPKIKIDEEIATVTGTLVFEMAGEQFEQDAAIRLVYKEDKWYISGFELL